MRAPSPRVPWGGAVILRARAEGAKGEGLREDWGGGYGLASPGSHPLCCGLDFSHPFDPG